MGINIGRGLLLDKHITKDTPRAERFDYDGFYKSLISRFFWNFLEMALPDLYADADTSREHEFLDKEFRDVLNTGDPEILSSPHFADYVIKIPMKNGGEEYLILHAEIQGKGGKMSISVRMYHYKCFIFAHYMKEPVALAIITDKQPPSEASSYSYSHYGTKTVYEYNNLVVMDLDDGDLLSSDNPVALVFYAAKSALKAKEELQKYNYLYTLAGLLAERGWSMLDKRDLLLFIERIINLKDKALKEQYWEYRQQLDKEGKVVYKHWIQEVEEEIVEQRGMEKKTERIVKNLLADGFSPEAIAKNTEWPIERVRGLIN